MTTISEMDEIMSRFIPIRRLDSLYIYILLNTAEKAKEILKEVRGAQEAFKKQTDLRKLEAEVRAVYMHHSLYIQYIIYSTVAGLL